MTEQAKRPRAAVILAALLVVAILGGGLWYLVAVRGTGGRRSRAALQRPDVLLVVYDARRRDDLSLGPFGNKRNDTPFLAKFAESAVFFEDAIAPGCWTIPVHASMFSGETVCDLGIDLYNPGWAAFAPSGPALAERLSAAGYRTVAFADHPYFYAPEQPETSLVRGFESFDVIRDFETYQSYTNIDTPGGEVSLVARLRPLQKRIRLDLERMLADFEAGHITLPDRAALDWDTERDVGLPPLGAMLRQSGYMEARYGPAFWDRLLGKDGDERPFFGFLNLHMCTLAVPDPGLLARWLAETTLINARHRGITLTLGEPKAQASLESLINQLGIAHEPFPTPYHYLKQVFDNRFYDATFEALWDELERRGRARDTLVVVASDHGMGLSERGERFWLHAGARPYDCITRVPLIVRYPEGTPQTGWNGHHGERVNLLDVYGTILHGALGPEWADPPGPSRSVADRLERAAFEDLFVSESSLLPVPHDDGLKAAGYAKAIYAGRYKLITARPTYSWSGTESWPQELRLGVPWERKEPRPGYDLVPEPLTLLFDLANDPKERVNLAQQKPEVVRELLAKVTDWSCEPKAPVTHGTPKWDKEAEETLRALGYVE